MKRAAIRAVEKPFTRNPGTRNAVMASAAPETSQCNAIYIHDMA